MFLELINSTIVDSSFFYLYFGIILISFGAMYFINVQRNKSMKNDYSFVEEYQNISLGQMDKPLITNESFVIWIIIRFKRIDEKDDKVDNSSSYFKNKFKIRGGQSWKEKAYSLNFINIAF